ncbi:DNA internalization-related competence protein ComEC/Rec2 [uncultured Anaerococcus sp.]|uniref:DNA internalization-related competence protein ComEC/Rec2 n=1 Tax=uncultured Anaerococcus sp. TaxID=293428 RepID=UPI003441D68D
MSVFLLGLILGILGFITYENLNIIYPILVLGILALIFYKKNKELTVLFLAVLLGFSMASFKFNRINPKEVKNININFTVIDKKKSMNSYRYTVKIKENKKKAFLFEDDIFEIGDEVKSHGDLKLISQNTNPNLFSYRAFAISKEVGLEFKPAKTNEGRNNSRSRNILLGLRRKFTSYVNNIFRENLSEDASDFVISVVLADSLFDRTDINKLGLAHILAISGFHIDLLLTFMVLILTRFGLSYKKSVSLSLFLALIYGYIIGFAYSIQRVLIVNLISFIGFLSRRAIDRVKSLILAALIILFINPFAILNTGFVLSFVTMLAIYKIYPSLKRFFKEGLLRDRLSFTASIQLAVLPFSAYYFRYFNILSILSNFLIVPIFEISMYIIFGIIFLYPIFRKLLRPGFFIIDILISSILNMTEFLARIPIFGIDFMAESITVSIFLFVLTYVLCNIKNSYKLDRFLRLSFLIVLLSISIRSFDKNISYEMIDIGQGDAFLLNDKGSYYMVDVGGPKYKDYDSGERILVPYLKSLGVKDIEGVFISHEDMDHAGNLDILCENFNVKDIITNDKVSKIFKDKYKPLILKEGDDIKLKSGKISCVYDGDRNTSEDNDKSLGILINLRGIKILSLGDLSSTYEDDLEIKADILKLSHHGSASSSSKKFIENTSPDLVLISAGRNNTYGHPAGEVLANTKDIRKYNTQTDGLVRIKFNKGRVRVEKYLKGGFFR